MYKTQSFLMTLIGLVGMMVGECIGASMDNAKAYGWLLVSLFSLLSYYFGFNLSQHQFFLDTRILLGALIPFGVNALNRLINLWLALTFTRICLFLSSVTSLGLIGWWLYVHYYDHRLFVLDPSSRFIYACLGILYGLGSSLLQYWVLFKSDILKDSPTKGIQLGLFVLSMLGFLSFGVLTFHSIYFLTIFLACASVAITTTSMNAKGTNTGPKAILASMPSWTPVLGLLWMAWKVPFEVLFPKRPPQSWPIPPMNETEAKLFAAALVTSARQEGPSLDSGTSGSTSVANSVAPFILCPVLFSTLMVLF